MSASDKALQSVTVQWSTRSGAHFGLGAYLPYETSEYDTDRGREKAIERLEFWNKAIAEYRKKFG